MLSDHIRSGIKIILTCSTFKPIKSTHELIVAIEIAQTHRDIMVHRDRNIHIETKWCELSDTRVRVFGVGEKHRCVLLDSQFD